MNIRIKKFSIYSVIAPCFSGNFQPENIEKRKKGISLADSPDVTTEAIRHALFDPFPKSRYAVGKNTNSSSSGSNSIAATNFLVEGKISEILVVVCLLLFLFLFLPKCTQIISWPLSSSVILLLVLLLLLHSTTNSFLSPLSSKRQAHTSLGTIGVK